MGILFASNTTGVWSVGPCRRVSKGSSGHPQGSAIRTSNEISDFRLEACRAYGAQATDRLRGLKNLNRRTFRNSLETFKIHKTI